MPAKHASCVDALLVEEGFDGDVYIDELMSKHTSYKIGGPARYFVRVNSLSALMALTAACKKAAMPYTIVGRGTNLLVSDDGFDGAIIVLDRDFRNFYVDVESSIIVAGAGANLASVVQEALRESLTGMEFAVGTPGSIGGALRMNAGSRDDWIGSRVVSVTILDANGELKRMCGRDVQWGYRSTSFSEGEVILECELALSKGDPFLIQGKMEGSLARRKRTQPLGQACCGSVFKNPQGASAAKMIDELGLKGTTIGAATVSTKHANFIINEGGAKATDVLRLIDLIEAKVEREYGTRLTPEVRFLGF